ncbi:MAG: ABC transporter permease, partial [Gemmataceae bacterium]|nr:ABC transporter permease [Gemmataceae bacterium]
MVQAIVWKEFREQGLIGLTLVVLGSGVLVAAAALADPPADTASLADVLRFLGAGRLATLLLAVTAGTVCGGALFAAEREAGTLGFLDALPASRWDIWVGKLAAGAALVVCQVAPLLVLAGLLGQVESAAGGFQLGLSALHAFVWGMYGSTVARTTLGSVGVAIPSAVLAAVVYAVPVFILFHSPRTNMLRPEGGLLLMALMFATPLAGSAYLFTRPDRDRTADDPSPARSRTAYSGWDPAEAAVPAPARRP